MPSARRPSIRASNGSARRRCPRSRRRSARCRDRPASPANGRWPRRAVDRPAPGVRQADVVERQGRSGGSRPRPRARWRRREVAGATTRPARAESRRRRARRRCGRRRDLRVVHQQPRVAERLAAGPAHCSMRSGMGSVSDDVAADGHDGAAELAAAAPTRRPSRSPRGRPRRCRRGCGPRGGRPCSSAIRGEASKMRTPRRSATRRSPRASSAGLDRRRVAELQPAERQRRAAPAPQLVRAELHDPAPAPCARQAATFCPRRRAAPARSRPAGRRRGGSGSRCPWRRRRLPIRSIAAATSRASHTPCSGPKWRDQPRQLVPPAGRPAAVTPAARRRRSVSCSSSTTSSDGSRSVSSSAVQRPVNRRRRCRRRPCAGPASGGHGAPAVASASSSQRDRVDSSSDRCRAQHGLDGVGGGLGARCRLQPCGDPRRAAAASRLASASSASDRGRWSA